MSIIPLAGVGRAIVMIHPSGIFAGIRPNPTEASACHRGGLQACSDQCTLQDDSCRDLAAKTR